ncbi:MAG: heme ABC transporter ATP-binding protein [Cellvibrionales bacterium]|nr:heme ABC transporter ATP-binding protein [Cellvibrionales bacterium]
MSISVAKLTVSYRNQAILDKLDFTAEAGELVALCGPNGAGKSTLLKAMSGELPYDGVIRMNDQDISHLSVQQLAQKRAVMPQQVDMQVSFSAREIIEMGMHLIESPEQKQQVFDKAVSLLSLESLLPRSYLALSGGQRQRVQLARVLVQVLHDEVKEPRYLLLDECTSAMDMAKITQVFGVLKQLAQDTSCPLGVVAVVHDLNTAALFADRIALIHNQVISHMGTPAEVLTSGVLENVYQHPVDVIAHPSTGTPFVLPKVA